MFGTKSLLNQQYMNDSVTFFQHLIAYLKIWSDMYPTNASGKKSVFVKYHEKYMKKRVHEVKYIQTFEPEGASVAK